MTVHFWGERAEGTWTLEIIDSPSKLRNLEVLGKVQQHMHTQARLHFDLLLQLKLKPLSSATQKTLLLLLLLLLLLGTGNLKEWTLILYGTSQNPYQPFNAQDSHSRMLEVPAPEEILEEPELEEEEEDEYNGERIQKVKIFPIFHTKLE